MQRRVIIATAVRPQSIRTAFFSKGRRIDFLRLARAQQTERVRRIGVLMNLAADDPEAQTRIVAFVQALQDLGWSDGRISTSAGPGAIQSATQIRGGIGRTSPLTA
jgi:hypothetical protein